MDENHFLTVFHDFFQEMAQELDLPFLRLTLAYPPIMDDLIAPWRQFSYEFLLAWASLAEARYGHQVSFIGDDPLDEILAARGLLNVFCEYGLELRERQSLRLLPDTDAADLSRAALAGAKRHAKIRLRRRVNAWFRPWLGEELCKGF